jgi:hypothetical protein
MRLFQDTLINIPSAAFNEETPNVGAIWCWLSSVCLFLVDNFEVKLNLINGCSVLSCEVLLNTSEETLSEVESRDPIIRWFSILDPRIDEFESLDEVDNVRGKWLNGWIGTSCPEGWNSVIEQGLSNSFQLGTHHNFSLNGSLNIDKRTPDSVQERIVPKDFLLQDSIHGLLVGNLVLLGSGVGIKSTWELGQDINGCFFEGIVQGLAIRNP